MTRIWQRPATSRGARFFMVLLITLVMGLPLYLISRTTEDREENRRMAAAEITNTWGGSQTIVGPVLMVPVEERSAATDPANQRVWNRQVILLPDSYDAAARVDAELRSKGIFTAPVYSATIDVTADFAAAITTTRFADQETPLWEQATLAIALTSTRGLRAHPVASWNGTALPLAAGASIGNLAGGILGTVIGDPRGNGGKAVVKLVGTGRNASPSCRWDATARSAWCRTGRIRASTAIFFRIAEPSTTPASRRPGRSRKSPAASPSGSNRARCSIWSTRPTPGRRWCRPSTSTG